MKLGNALSVSAAISAGLRYDEDARAYISAVEAADGQFLESGVKDSINAFVVGCKADNLWGKIKASCILMGARTLSGILVDIKSATTIATNNLFVSADYNRESGLLGDGSTKYINSGRSNNADPRNDNHNAVYVTALGSSNRAFMAAGASGQAGVNFVGIATVGGNYFLATRSRGSGDILVEGASAVGLAGISRTALESFSGRTNKSYVTGNFQSFVPASSPVLIFARGLPGSLSSVSSARISFYSIGEGLELAALDSRVEALSVGIANAIV